MIMSLKRKSGEHAGQVAELNVYSDGRSHLVLAMSPSDAQKLTEAAVIAGGSADVEIHYNGSKVAAAAIAARINTVSSSGKKLTGPGVVGFAFLELGR
jgi:hypothetical protein